jgi:transcriptional regulator with XRE-family HTH domain
MPPRISPTLRHKRLAARLVQLRNDQGYTATEVAKRAGWAPSKLSRVENRQYAPDPDDVALLLDIYGVTEEADPRQRAELLKLARDARRSGWWDDYRLPASYSDYVGLEAEATVLRNWEPGIVPGLLQTADYARELIARRAPELSDRQVEERVEARMERQQKLLYGPDPLALWAVVEEGAFHRMVGDRQVMAAQLEHLIKMTEAEHITLQVLPFSAGVAPAGGPFAVLSFEEPDREIVYVETPAGDLFVEELQQVESFLIAFVRVMEAAMNVRDTLDLISARLDQVQGTDHGQAGLA